MCKFYNCPMCSITTYWDLRQALTNEKIWLIVANKAYLDSKVLTFMFENEMVQSNGFGFETLGNVKSNSNKQQNILENLEVSL